jgi:hypothetical protein
MTGEKKWSGDGSPDDGDEFTKDGHVEWIERRLSVEQLPS